MFHHTLTIDHLKWPLKAVLITSPGLGVRAGPGPGAQPVGHVVQGRLQALHVLHQLHAELLGPLLQSSPALNRLVFISWQLDTHYMDKINVCETLRGTEYNSLVCQMNVVTLTGPVKQLQHSNLLSLFWTSLFLARLRPSLSSSTMLAPALSKLTEG